MLSRVNGWNSLIKNGGGYGKMKSTYLSKEDSCYSAPDTVLRELNLVILSRGQEIWILYKFYNFQKHQCPNKMWQCQLQSGNYRL